MKYKVNDVVYEKLSDRIFIINSLPETSPTYVLNIFDTFYCLNDQDYFYFANEGGMKEDFILLGNLDD